MPISLREANAFVSKHHRHHGPARGHKFSLAVAEGDEIVGVAIVGRPVGRHLDDGWTLEVNRTCTDGTKHANSMLYSAAWRAAKAMGYRRLVTYTVASESGSSLRGAGWRVVAERAPRGEKGSWAAQSKGRPSVDTTHGVARTLWEAV